MEYYAIYTSLANGVGKFVSYSYEVNKINCFVIVKIDNFKISLNFSADPEKLIFEEQKLCSEALKTYKDGRFNKFKSRSEALKFVKNGPSQTQNQSQSALSIFSSIVKRKYKKSFEIFKVFIVRHLPKLYKHSKLCVLSKTRRMMNIEMSLIGKSEKIFVSWKNIFSKRFSHFLLPWFSNKWFNTQIFSCLFCSTSKSSSNSFHGEEFLSIAQETGISSFSKGNRAKQFLGCLRNDQY